jgi:hypothetical protein
MEAARPRVSQDVLLLAIKGPMAQRISRSVLTDQRIYENERQASRLGSARRFQPTQTHIIPSHAVWPRHSNGSLQIHLTVPRPVLSPSRPYGYRTIYGKHLSATPEHASVPHVHHVSSPSVRCTRPQHSREFDDGSPQSLRTPCHQFYCCPLVWPLHIPRGKVRSRRASVLASGPTCSQSVSTAQLLTLLESAMPQSLHTQSFIRCQGESPPWVRLTDLSKVGARHASAWHPPLLLRGGTRSAPR